MRITVPDKTKILIFFGTLRGVAWLVCCSCFHDCSHNKFSPDWCFGLLKHKFRWTRVSCLNDIVSVVEESSVVNQACLVGNELGKTLTPTYDWINFFFSYFRKLPGIKSYHHIRFSAASPGVAYIKALSDSQEEILNMLKANARAPSGVTCSCFTCRFGC